MINMHDYVIDWFFPRWTSGTAIYIITFKGVNNWCDEKVCQ